MVKSVMTVTMVSAAAAAAAAAAQEYQVATTDEDGPKYAKNGSMAGLNLNRTMMEVFMFGGEIMEALNHQKVGNYRL
jgi:hypothetical protein